ncbi:hypothetical protein SAMN05421810_101255 [Amycolatopsis arida]|uniref:Uncharacterized protein n=2 Tax=Amycolatopsis arida TaxID=587909 RepID=A0A1I5KPW3_9PSEU|nr:hypothetical protein CLV69_102253 [Amycolatopsis arida]SFO87149.1 hypothetical protein SAMN05421810_101255 [Amycolatopsis arida]
MIRALYTGLLDDAALFPPGELPLSEAVPAHHRHRAAAHADLVGPFVFPAPRLAELGAVLDRPLAVSLTVPGGPAELGPALVSVAGHADVRLVAVELAQPDEVSPGEVLAALAELPPGVTGYVEVPRGPARSSTLDALAGSPYRAKFRTGGVVAAAHPDEAELADAIVGAVTRDLPFKCTAGLHHAVRHTEAGTGFEQHGFLNVLLATDAAAGGADRAEVAALLGERSTAKVVAGIRVLDAGRVGRARDRFVSFGTCSVADPVRDLVDLGLLPPAGGDDGKDTAGTDETDDTADTVEGEH